MWSTDVLREEHRWILAMLQCLERVQADAERAGRLDAGSAAELIALFRHFADGLHQEREEAVLFPRLLGRARTVAERLDVARLCGAHEEERRGLVRLDEELLGAIYGEERSLREFLRAARRYVALQRAHVLHENETLLPLAERILSPADDEAVVQGFASLERGGPAAAKQVFARVRALCQHLGFDAD